MTCDGAETVGSFGVLEEVGGGGVTRDTSVNDTSTNDEGQVISLVDEQSEKKKSLQ